METCPGCGAEFPPTAAAPHPYIGASPGCWSAYTAVVAREYGEWSNPPIHRLTVDAYAAQHPGEESRQTVQSVAVHLIGLHLALDRGLELERVAREIGRAVAAPRDFFWLEPPTRRASVTIRDVADAESLRDHTRRVRWWAQAVWDTWSDHHQTVRAWARSMGDERPDRHRPITAG